MDSSFAPCAMISRALASIRRKIPHRYALAARPGAAPLAGEKKFRHWLISEISRHKRAMQLA